MDGTLVETEQLKAISYARAAMELRPAVNERDVIDAFKDVVGGSREVVSNTLMQRFGLEDAARARMGAMGVTQAWEVLGQLHVQSYEAMLSDAALVRRYQYPHNVNLLRWAHAQHYKTGLTTMSHRNQVEHILSVLGVRELLNVIATREDVKNPKPDPEIYKLVIGQLGVQPTDCIAIEDSLAGVKAGLAAGVDVIGVGTMLTGKSLHESGVLPPDRLVDDPTTLPDVVAAIIKQHTEPLSV